MERTLVLLKPDAIQRELIGEIISVFEKKCFKITGLKILYLKSEAFEKIYANIKDKPYYQQTYKYMTNEPCVALILEGPDAIKRAIDICGPSNLDEAHGCTIRGRYALWTGCDVVHRSDDEKKAEEIIELLFQNDEIIKYNKINEKYIREDLWQ